MGQLTTAWGIRMRHVARTRSQHHISMSRVTCEWVMSHMKESSHTTAWGMRMSRVARNRCQQHISESSQNWRSNVTCEWVISQLHEARECVTLGRLYTHTTCYIWVSHDTYERVMSCRSYVICFFFTYQKQTSQTLLRHTIDARVLMSLSLSQSICIFHSQTRLATVQLDSQRIHNEFSCPHTQFNIQNYTPEYHTRYIPHRFNNIHNTAIRNTAHTIQHTK